MHMRIIPVLDILNAQVVHGIKGERSKYAPIQSILTPSSKPIDVAKAFKLNFPISELYIADLNAIMQNNSQFEYLEEIAQQTQLSIMLDAGIDDYKLIPALLKKGVNKIIIGTETLQSFNHLEQIIQRIETKNLIVSLDLKDGKILSKAKEVSSQSHINFLQRIEELRIQELIVLELAKVGSESGVMTPILQDILDQASIPIITGGGARNVQDLRILKDAGVSGALIATALHKGTIPPQALHDLKK